MKIGKVEVVLLTFYLVVGALVVRELRRDHAFVRACHEAGGVAITNESPNQCFKADLVPVGR